MNSAKISVLGLLPVFSLCHSRPSTSWSKNGLRKRHPSGQHPGKEKEKKIEFRFFCFEENAVFAMPASALTCGHRWAVGWAVLLPSS